MGHGDDRARVLVEISLEPGDDSGIEVIGRLVEQQHVGLLTAAAGTARRGASRRRRAWSRPRPTAGSRSASAAISSWRSSSQAPARFDRVLQPCPAPRAASSISSSSIGSANFMLISLNRSTSALVSATPSSTLPRTSFAGSSSRLLRQVADRDARLGPGLAFDSLSTPAMIRSRSILPEPFRPSTPILAPGKNDERDVPQDEPLRAAPPWPPGSSCRCIAP